MIFCCYYDSYYHYYEWLWWFFLSLWCVSLLLLLRWLLLSLLCFIIFTVTWSQAAAHYFAMHVSFDLHGKASWNSQILETSFMGPWQGFYRFQVQGRTFPPDLSMAGHVPHHRLKESFPLEGSFHVSHPHSCDACWWKSTTTERH